MRTVHRTMLSGRPAWATVARADSAGPVGSEWSKLDRLLDRAFAEATQELLATDVDIVLLCSPPQFRPRHLKQAIAAGKPLMNGVLYGVDTRSVDEIAELNGAIGADTILERCGNDECLRSDDYGMPKVE